MKTESERKVEPSTLRDKLENPDVLKSWIHDHGYLPDYIARPLIVAHEREIAALRLVVCEVECYCVSDGVANKGPCARCLAQAALKLAGKEGE